MDGNKDEALKCLQIGRQALKAGDRARALKFVTKARHLDPTLSVDDLLSGIEGQSGTTVDESSSSPPTKPSGKPSVRRKVPSTGSSSSASSVAYTEEQIAIVRQIRGKKDLYEILGLEKTCTVDDVRKAYRKLSLKVHPDKNSAPGAEEAFKAVSKAFQCLSDDESRKRYDLVGSDEPVYERRAAARHGHASNGFNGFYASDVDADEIFRNFFFGGMPAGATTQFGGFSFGTGMGPRMAADHGSAGFNVRALIQILPVLLVLLLNFLPTSEPIYSLSRRQSYEYQFVTQKGVNYYVKSENFEQKYPPDSPERLSLERQVESDYVSTVSQHCQQEMQRYRWGYIKETPYCDMLRRYQSVA